MLPEFISDKRNLFNWDKGEKKSTRYWACVARFAKRNREEATGGDSMQTGNMVEEWNNNSWKRDSSAWWYPLLSSVIKRI